MGFSFEAITDPSYELTIQDGAFVNANIKEVCTPAHNLSIFLYDYAHKLIYSVHRK